MKARQAARPIARGAAVTGMSQAAAMLAGAVLAALVAVKLGTSARTDGFFVAYALYGLFLVIAQSARMTSVARLVAARSLAGFDRELGAALVLFLGCGGLFALLAGPLADLVVGGLSPAGREAFRSALLVLWPAAGGQLFAALAAAMLGLRGDHLRPALAYAGGGTVSIVAFLALEGSMGVAAASGAVVAGTAATALALAWALRRAGWRPARLRPLELRALLGRAGSMVLSSSSMALGQVLFVVSAAAAGGLGPGAPTLYSYAFFGLGMVIALLASSLSIVMAAPLAATWDRRPSSLRPHADDVFRTGLMALAPVLAAAALLGDDLGRALPGMLGDAQVKTVVGAFLALAPCAVAAQAVAVPLLALYALGRQRAIALLALAVVPIHVALSLAAVELGSLPALAGASSVSSLAFAAGILVLVHGRATVRLGLHLLAELTLVALIAGASFAAGALVLLGGSSATGEALALLLGLCLYGAAVGRLLPAHRLLVARAVRSLRRQTSASAQASGVNGRSSARGHKAISARHQEAPSA